MRQIADFKRQWGISTLCLRDMSLDQAIGSVFKQGFHVFELVPRVYGGLDRFDQSMRTDLQEKLSCFDTVTVHSSGPSVSEGRKADITSSDPAHRQRSIDYYLSLIHLAADIGAQLVTFHPGIGDETTTPAQVREANRAFAEIALDKTQDTDLGLAFENFDLDLSRQIGSSRFGILFDVGHAALRFKASMTDGILKLLKELYPYIFQFHFHGVHVSPNGDRKDHQPFQKNNGIAYHKIIQDLLKYGYSGPMIFEIGIFSDNGTENLIDTVAARNELMDGPLS